MGFFVHDCAEDGHVFKFIFYRRDEFVCKYCGMVLGDGGAYVKHEGEGNVPLSDKDVYHH